MIEARLVWDTWRRILTDDALADAARQPSADLASLALTPAETAILADYAIQSRRRQIDDVSSIHSGLVPTSTCAFLSPLLSCSPLHGNEVYVDEVLRFRKSNQQLHDAPTRAPAPPPPPPRRPAAARPPPPPPPAARPVSAVVMAR